MTRTRWATALAAAALLAGLTACSGDDSSTAAPSEDRASSDTTSEPAGANGVVDPDLEAAAGDPLEDSVYPDVGDPSVDALHYDLDVAWDPEGRTLTGEEELTFRSTGDELLALTNAGLPFYKPPWSGAIVGLVLDDDTDWTEVAELVIDSYRCCAPQKLVRLLDGPDRDSP